MFGGAGHTKLAIATAVMAPIICLFEPLKGIHRLAIEPIPAVGKLRAQYRAEVMKKKRRQRRFDCNFRALRLIIHK